MNKLIDFLDAVDLLVTGGFLISLAAMLVVVVLSLAGAVEPDFLVSSPEQREQAKVEAEQLRLRAEEVLRAREEAEQRQAFETRQRRLLEAEEQARERQRQEDLAEHQRGMQQIEESMPDNSVQDLVAKFRKIEDFDREWRRTRERERPSPLGEVESR